MALPTRPSGSLQSLETCRHNTNSFTTTTENESGNTAYETLTSENEASPERLLEDSGQDSNNYDSSEHCNDGFCNCSDNSDEVVELLDRKSPDGKSIGTSLDIYAAGQLASSFFRIMLGDTNHQVGSTPGSINLLEYALISTGTSRVFHFTVDRINYQFVHHVMDWEETRQEFIMHLLAENDPRVQAMMRRFFSKILPSTTLFSTLPTTSDQFVLSVPDNNENEGCHRVGLDMVIFAASSRVPNLNPIRVPMLVLGKNSIYAAYIIYLNEARQVAWDNIINSSAPDVSALKPRLSEEAFCVAFAAFKGWGIENMDVLRSKIKDEIRAELRLNPMGKILPCGCKKPWYYPFLQIDHLESNHPRRQVHNEMFRNEPLTVFLEDIHMIRDMEKKVELQPILDLWFHCHPLRKALLKKLKNYHKCESVKRKKELFQEISRLSEDFEKLNSDQYSEIERAKLFKDIQTALEKVEETKAKKNQKNLPRTIIHLLPNDGTNVEVDNSNREQSDTAQVSGGESSKSTSKKRSHEGTLKTELKLENLGENFQVYIIQEIQTNTTNVEDDNLENDTQTNNLDTKLEDPATSKKVRSNKSRKKSIKTTASTANSNCLSSQVIPSTIKGSTSSSRIVPLENDTIQSNSNVALENGGVSTPLVPMRVQLTDPSNIEASGETGTHVNESTLHFSAGLTSTVSETTQGGIDTSQTIHTQHSVTSNNSESQTDEWEPYEQLLEDQWTTFESKSARKSRGRAGKSLLSIPESSRGNERAIGRNFQHLARPVSYHKHLERGINALDIKSNETTSSMRKATTSSVSKAKAVSKPSQSINDPQNRYITTPASMDNFSSKKLDSATKSMETQKPNLDLKQTATVKAKNSATSMRATPENKQKKNTSDKQQALSPIIIEADFPPITPQFQEPITTHKKPVIRKVSRPSVSPSRKHDNKPASTTDAQEAEVSGPVTEPLGRYVLRANELTETMIKAFNMVDQIIPTMVSPPADISKTLTSELQVEVEEETSANMAQQDSVIPQDVDVSDNAGSFVQGLVSEATAQSDALLSNTAQSQENTLSLSQKADIYCKEHLSFVEDIKSPIKYKHHRQRSSSITIPVPEKLTEAEHYEEKVCAGDRYRACSDATHPPNAIGFERKDLELYLSRRAPNNNPIASATNASDDDVVNHSVTSQMYNNASNSHQTLDNPSYSPQMTDNHPFYAHTNGAPPYGGRVSYNIGGYGQIYLPLCAHCRLPDRQAFIEQPVSFCSFCPAGGPSNRYCSHNCLVAAAVQHREMHMDDGAPVAWVFGRSRPAWHSSR